MNAVSVCMASYNGSKYIEEQILSILEELHPSDELIIVDDCSTDGTVDIARQLSEMDARVTLFENEENRGYVYSFGRAVGLARGSVVLLADQDDRWTRGRRNLLQRDAESCRGLVASSFTMFNERGKIDDVIVDSRASSHNLRNILFTIAGGFRPYYGCTMAIHRDLLDVILPIPSFLDETHDQWIALVGNVAGRVVHEPQITVARRIHADNTTPKTRRPLARILKGRVRLAIALCIAFGRVLALQNRH